MLKMRCICLALFALVASAANEYNYTYDNQAAWRDLKDAVCGICNRQSPINIVPATAQSSSTLQNLIFINWDGRVDGTFSNKGHNVQFDPSVKGTSTVNQKGTYVLQQLHFHWGEGQRDGSEHRIQGSQYDAEIHFVHRKQGAPDGSTDIDTLTVLAVFGIANDAAPITGIWNQLQVPSTHRGSFPVSGIRYSDLLPSNRDYYYYEGSLTTPPCSEVVQWFVLKEPIQIPSAYISRLRTVQENNRGTLLTHNVRDVQPLNGRIVMTPMACTTTSPAGPTSPPTTCAAAGFTSGCCTSTEQNGCYVAAGSCWCDSYCYDYNNCCSDIATVGCQRSNFNGGWARARARAKIQQQGCAAAGHSGCCTGGNCRTASGCYCGVDCYLFRNCCDDITVVGCYPPQVKELYFNQ